MEISDNWIKINSLNIHYYKAGHGYPLVIIHGSGDGARSWKRNMVALACHYTVYIPDLPGFGLSEALPPSNGLPELVQFVADFTRAIGLQRFHLVGHSIGGGIALQHSIKFPDTISKLVLVNSMYLGEDIAAWVRIMSNSAFCNTMGIAGHNVLKAFKWLIKKVYAPIDFFNPLPLIKVSMGKLMQTLGEQTILLQQQFPVLVMPVLLVWGDRDTIVPVSNAYAARELLPRCQLQILNGGHSVYKQKIRAFSRLLIKFLG